MAAFTAIDNPGEFFSTTLYTGTGSSNAITGVGFQPDLVWCKQRTDPTASHCLVDAPRGVDNFIATNAATAEVNDAYNVTAFGADGFTVGASSGSADINVSTETYCGWCWKGGTTTGIAGSPSITPTAYSFSQDSGFSVIRWTGDEQASATIPHGLASAPHCVFTKSLDSGSDWGVYHFHADATAPEDYAFKFNTTAIRADQVAMWTDTQPSSTLVTLGTENRSNNIGDMIAYCFAPVQGFSKFGTYVGNGNVDGPFVYTGFRPAFIITKDADNGLGNWNIFNSKTLGYNEENRLMTCNQTAAEIDRNMDLLSNGFKPRDSGQSNENNSNYIYLSFAEAPFVNSNSVPCNAR